MLIRIIPTLLLALLCACPNQQEPTPPKAEEDETRIRLLMKKQLEAVDSIHYAIAFGELGKARESSNWLANNAMVTPVPHGWAPKVSAVQVSAEKMAGGKKLGDIGEAMGAMLEACGTCHEELGLALVAASNVGPPRESGNKEMLQHTFAMTQLEHGLLLPSEVLWDQGAAMIGAGSFDLKTDLPSAMDAKESDAIAAELKELGANAERAKSLQAKGKLYGQMMARCNGCHDRSRERGGAK